MTGGGHGLGAQIEHAGRLVALTHGELPGDLIDHDNLAFAAVIDERFAAIGFHEEDRRDFTAESEIGLDPVVKDEIGLCRDLAFVGVIEIRAGPRHERAIIGHRGLRFRERQETLILFDIGIGKANLEHHRRPIIDGPQEKIVDALSRHDVHIGDGVGFERLDEEKALRLVRHSLPSDGIADRDGFDAFIVTKRDHRRDAERAMHHDNIVTLKRHGSDTGVLDDCARRLFGQRGSGGEHSQHQKKGDRSHGAGAPVGGATVGASTGAAPTIGATVSWSFRYSMT